MNLIEIKLKGLGEVGPNYFLKKERSLPSQKSLNRSVKGAGLVVVVFLLSGLKRYTVS
jgi:hypothetical protein